MSITFVDCDRAWLAPLRRLLARAYSPSYRLLVDEALFTWQFGEQGGLGSYRFKLAVAGSEVQACLGYVPVDLSVAGTIARGAWTANWMVDPTARRLGLGPLLLRQLVGEFDAVLSVGLEREACEILPRMGFHDFGDLCRYVCVLDATAAARLTERGRLVWPVAPPSRVEDDATMSLGMSAAEDADIEDLWDRVWGRCGAGTRRSAQFLRWRYDKHPTFEYHTVVSRSSTGRLVGIAVYRAEQVRDLPVRVGRIVELIAEAHDVAPLLGHVVHRMQEGGVAVVDFFCSSRALEPPLVAAGFLPPTLDAPRQIPILFQPLDRRRSGIRFMAHTQGLSNIGAVREWYVTKGDGDQDRPN